MKKPLFLFGLFSILIYLTLAGCQNELPAVTPTVTPTAIPSPTPSLDLQQYLNQKEDLAPKLIESNPAAGGSISPAAGISLSFDMPMDQPATAKALLVTDASQKPVDGTVFWKNPRTLVFQPKAALQPGKSYLAFLNTTARSTAGKALEQPTNLSFQATGTLQVSQVFPADGTQDVANTATITVMFNRPVVPLVIAEEQAKLVNPIQIEPAIKGTGQWVNTSLYVFHPGQILTGGQTYRVRVDAGLADATGDAASALDKEVSWSFTVAAPSIQAVTINDLRLDNNLANVPLNSSLKISFRQPMDRPSVEAGLRLTAAGAGPVTLQFKWDEKSTQVEAKPSQILALGTNYFLTLVASAKSAEGGSLVGGLARTFTTVPFPSILRTLPNDQDTNGELNFTIFFAAPMDFKSLADKVIFSPALDTKTHSFYNPGSKTLSFYGLLPSTKYTVRILAGMRDPYGNAITDEKDVTFTTRSLNPSAMLLMPWQAVMRAEGPQDFYVQYVNLTSLDMAAFRLTLDQLASIFYPSGKGSSYSGQPQDQVWHSAPNPVGKPDESVLKDVALKDPNGKSLDPGIYFLELNAAPINYSRPYIDSRVFFVSTENITVKASPGQVLAWVTNLTSGKPTPGVKVKIFENNFVQAAEGVTDANGLFQADVSAPMNNNLGGKGNYQGGWYAVVQDSSHFGIASSDWGSGVSPSSFGLFDQYYSPWKDATAYVYTERPLYRPGQPVYFKGIVRSDDDLAYSLPDQKQVQVTINSYKEQVLKQTLPISDIGTFDGVFHLADDAALGSYTLQVQWPDGQTSLGGMTFDVAEYRRPEFQVDLQAAPSNVLPGDIFNVSLAAAYYSGGGLADADVSWTLRSEPYSFTPPAAFSPFSFSNETYDNWSYYNSSQTNQKSGQIAQGSAKTDGDGKLSLPVTAQAAAAKTSQNLIFEATITDFAGTSVSGQAQVAMHQSAVYPGVRARSYIGLVGQQQAFEVTLLDWDGKPQPGAKVDLEIVQRQWFSVQVEGDNGVLTWQTSVKEIPAASFSGVTLDDKGLASVNFTPAVGGIYRARVSAKDSHANPAQASTFTWVAGTDFVPWFQTNDRSFQLVADRDSYAPGDTAQLLIASPFQGESYALLTVERGHVRQSEVLRLPGNSTLYKLPVTASMAPDIFVSVVVVKGVDQTNPRPNFKVGIVRLKVTTNQQSLQVKLSSDHDQAAPQARVVYTVQTTTQDGKPVPAEVSLALSDLATLSLKDSTVPPLLDFFYSPRSLSVITGVGITQSSEDYNANISKQTQANGQGAGSGGGKGSGYTGVMEIRQDFPDTAFWQADLQTDASGKASVTVTLPDNLTTWRMDARAVTADTRVGQTTLDLVSTRPLLVRPQTPRFFVVGDIASLGAAVHNNTDQALDVTVKLDATGVTLGVPAEQKVTIPAKRQAYINWEVSVPANSTRVDLVFSVQGGGFSDASRPTLGTLDHQGIPVYRYEVPETVGTSGILSENGARTESISLPPSMSVQKGQLIVDLAPSLAAGMTDGLTYLTQYPYLCTEQTISRFLPNILLTAALQAAGVHDPAMEEGLKTQVNLALQKLSNNQNPDSGWGWWNGMESDTLTTAYATLGLVEARKAGYTVGDALFNKAVTFLQNHLQSFGDLADPWELNRQAFVLYILGRAGSPEVSKTVQLYDQRQAMSLYARAYLLQTLYHINPADTRLKTLVSDLSSAAILSAAGAHWEEKSADTWNWNTDLRSTSIILDALVETDPGNALNAAAARFLMSNRQNGRWESTQETAWSLMALTDWANATQDLNPNYTYGVAFNGKQLLQDTASPQTNRQTRQLSLDVTQMLAEEANRLVLARSGSSGSLYYTAYLNLWLPVDQVQALDRGVVISRQYFRPDDLTRPVTEARQGDVLLARLTLVAPTTLRYLHVDDPLPAGMEAVDTSLKTSPKAQQPEGYDWSRIGTDGWGWWYFSHIELRDEKVVLSTDQLPAGTYVYTYLVRASTPGTFNVIPPSAQQFYFPDVYGRGSGSQFIIKP